MSDVERLLKQIVATLKKGGVQRAAASSQRFFSEPVVTFGWRTPDLDRYGRQLFRSLKLDIRSIEILALELSRQKSNEEFQLAVCLLQQPAKSIHTHFAVFTRMLKQADNWSKCDALAIRLIGPALLQNPEHVKVVVSWAKSKNPWKRRVAAASLVLAARRKQFHREIREVADTLAADDEIIVQKGLGWLLRELGKASPELGIACLHKLRGRTSRLVLRTACEKLPLSARNKILAR
jgi:3-methyladenine DNA glycosylase AlkD